MAFDPSGKGQIVELGTLADLRQEPQPGALNRNPYPSVPAKIDAAVKRAISGKK
jgi:hypothetical protein